MKIVVAAAFLAALTTPAFAHAFLQHASPGAGQTVAAPKQIDLTFDKTLEPSLSGASITDADGHDAGAGPAHVEDTLMTLPLPALKPGTSHVTWHVVSTDAHQTQGSYNFTVQP